jgi:hypothetical protein
MVIKPQKTSITHQTKSKNIFLKLTQAYRHITSHTIASISIVPKSGTKKNTASAKKLTIMNFHRNHGSFILDFDFLISQLAIKITYQSLKNSAGCIDLQNIAIHHLEPFKTNQTQGIKTAN